MISLKDIRDKKVLVIGLGLHGGGVSVVRWLCKNGALVKVTDLRQRKDLLPSIKKLKTLNVKYVLGKHCFSDIKEADLLVQNPGVPQDSKYILYAKKLGKQIENEASIFFKECPAPIIGITGSKGKSTLTTLIYQILKRQFKDVVMAGNIRDVLMLDALPKVRKKTKVVLELSSWHLEGMEPYRKSPKIGVITNVLAEHLNRYKSIGNYAQSKFIILKFQKTNDFAVLNYDNSYTRRFGKKTKSKVINYSTKKILKDGCYFLDGNIVFKDKKIFGFPKDKKTPEHFLEHFLAATCLAKLSKVKNKNIENAIKNFKGLHDRLEFLGKIKGISYYNDTTATMPDATVAALKSLGSEKRNIILLAGGADKKLHFEKMAKYIPRYCKAVFLFKGLASNKLYRLIRKLKIKKIVSSMEEAVFKAKKVAQKDDIIILSPGAASFGLFKHEFDRGAQFKKYIKKR